MIARKRLDIGWGDIARGLRWCLRPGAAQADGFCQEESLVCLSVRSGFDLFLTALALPAGSEVLVSAITIPDLPRILREHGLVPVPVDLDFATVSVSAAALRAALTPQTKAILVAHLFGSRMPLEPVFEVAREHGLLVLEDCAQAFVGRDFTGDVRSDVRMFSFGPIKTATALGGGVLFVRDPGLRAKMEALHGRWPRQSQLSFWQRLCTFAFFKAALSPAPFTIIVWLFRLIGRSHDAVVTGSARSFRGEDFFHRIRRQPSLALQRLVSHRLRTYAAARVEERAAAGRELLAAIPRDLALGGGGAAHTFWLFPIVCARPEDWMRRLWRAGFDAARGSTSLHPVDPPSDRPERAPSVAREACAGVLYLPVYPEMGAAARRRLAALVTQLDAEENRANSRGER